MTDKQSSLMYAVSALAGAAVTYFVLSKQQQKKDDPVDPTGSKELYETKKLVDQYNEFHFTSGKDLFPYDPNMKVSEAFDFTTRLGRMLNEHAPKGKKIRALDLGCAVGNSSFEMSKVYDEVVGVDLSAGFINSANHVLSTKTVDYLGPDQGDIQVARTYTIPSDVKTERIKFVVGDALNVDPALGTFDGLLAANLVCRVPEPEKLIRSFAKLVNKDGVVLICSPYSWWEEATDKSKWLGGKVGGSRSEEIANGIMKENFELVSETSQPWLIRDHCRRFQLGMGHVTIWRRK